MLNTASALVGLTFEWKVRTEYMVPEEDYVSLVCGTATIRAISAAVQPPVFLNCTDCGTRLIASQNALDYVEEERKRVQAKKILPFCMHCEFSNRGDNDSPIELAFDFDVDEVCEKYGIDRERFDQFLEHLKSLSAKELAEALGRTSYGKKEDNFN